MACLIGGLRRRLGIAGGSGGRSTFKKRRVASSNSSGLFIVIAHSKRRASTPDAFLLIALSVAINNVTSSRRFPRRNRIWIFRVTLKAAQSSTIR